MFQHYSYMFRLYDGKIPFSVRDLLKNFNFILDMQNKYCTADIQDEEGQK